MMSNVKKKDVPLISISLVAILFIAATLSLFPQQSADAANAIYTFVTRTLGSAVQVLVLLAMGLVIYLATSKYGNIRLGEGKPEYSTLSWLFMFICAGNTGFRNESRIFYFIHLQNEKDYERKKSSSA